MHKARIHLMLSEAQWDMYPDQAGDEACVDTFTIFLPEGPWVQFTYSMLRQQNGDPAPICFDAESGFWRTEDGRVWSDVAIEILEA